MLKDLRHSLRMLLRAKGWTAVVLISLALGIGANTALFSAINGLLLKKLPVSEPDSLVRLRFAGRNEMATNSSDYGLSRPDASGQQQRATFSYPMFQTFRAENRTLTDLVACAPYGRVNLVVDGQAEIATAFISSGNFYQMLGVTAAPGRTIVPEDDQHTAAPVAVISARYWHVRFGSDPAVVGKGVTINNVPVTIVGVLSPTFTGVQQSVSEAPDVAIPLALDPQVTPPMPPPPGAAAPGPRLSLPTTWWLQVLGRLKPGVTAEQVQANLEGAFQRTARAGFDSYVATLSEEARSTSSMRSRTLVPQLRVSSGSRGVYDANATDLRAVTILGAVVVVVLLIVCANVANLLLSRATTRQKEISIRLSMGATRPRLIRQLLTESLLLASIGGGLGVLVGNWGQRLLPGVPGRATSLDWRVLTFALVVTGLTGLVFGIAPALRATRMNVSSSLKETSRSVAGSRSLLSKLLLVVQVALSLMLLVGAGLFLRTLQNLRSENVGFNPQRLVLFRVNPQLNRYDPKRAAALYTQMMERLKAVPGIRDVALSQPALLSGAVNSTSIFVQGRSYSPGQDTNINRLVISPNFFETMEIPLVAGRGFAASDGETAPKVAVINEAAARAYFPNQNPVGLRFGNSVEESGGFEIVGLLRDAKYDSVRNSAPPTMYVPYTQSPPSTTVFEVRAAGDPTGVIMAVREAVRELDPNLPLMDVSTQMELVERRFVQEKVMAQAYTLFGGLAILLASVGLFGLMSYTVARRTNEIGVRMALGAQPLDVLRLLMGESMILVAAGVVIGLVATIGAGRLVASLLFGVPATDMFTIVFAVLLMLTVSAIAGYLPARRASRVDPMVALHYE
jgi:predicted permease